MYGRLVVEEELHPDEGLPALLGEHVPGLGPGQEVGHAALGQAQHSLPEQALADAVLGQDLLDAPDHIVRVEVTVPDTSHDHTHPNHHHYVHLSNCCCVIGGSTALFLLLLGLPKETEGGEVIRELVMLAILWSGDPVPGVAGPELTS